MRRLHYWVLVGGLCGLALVPARVQAAAARAPVTALVEFDRGEKKGERLFRSADDCHTKPCGITQHGALRFHASVPRQYRVEMGYIHGGVYRPIDLFQQSTSLEQKLGERLLNRHPNRKIVNLSRMVERGDLNTVYVYGLRLQYEMAQGDPIVVRLIRYDRPDEINEYYFRYHHAGVRADFDLAFLYPINYFHPNPNDTIQSANAGIAFSLSAGTNMDPDRRYSWFSKIMRSVRLNLFTGVINRRVLGDIAGDRVIQDDADGFGGVGLTFFDFLIAGYGINVFHTPRSAFPFVGLEFRHAFDFIRSLKSDTHTKWEQYLEAEQGRAAKPRQTSPRLNRYEHYR